LGEAEVRTMADGSDPTFGAPPPDSELRRLEALVGRWSTEDHTLDTAAGGPGVPVLSTEAFHWLEGGYFLVQTYATTFGDAPAQRGVNYFGYDSEARRFLIVFFSNNGPFTEDGNRYRGKVADGKLTFEGPARFQYELDDDGKIKTNADGTISVTWWLRDENGVWKLWMNNTFVRATD
jgi:Protein of unknown function (DUF1579)